jgi:hypothetical protein
MTGVKRPVMWFTLIAAAAHLAFAWASYQYHLDGDNTISLIQANDWAFTPHTDYFWGQQYMGTTEVWLFSSLWRLAFGDRSVIPLQYWIVIAQMLFVAGAALTYAGLVFTDREWWGRRRVFLASLIVLGFTVPVFQKYSFGLGHGYSATPLYAGLTAYLYLKRDAVAWPWWVAAGALLGQSHYIFRLHLVYPVALGIAMLLAGARAYAPRIAALAAGVIAGMMPERLFRPPQGYSMSVCAGSAHHVIANAWQTVSQLAVHVVTVPDSLFESEHALWFNLHRPLPATWASVGLIAGGALVIVLTAVQAWRDAKSPAYRIFSILLAVNLAVVAVSCIPLDPYAARRYLYPAALPVAFFVLNGPWTIPQQVALATRTVGFAVYAVSALAFTTPLARFTAASVPAGFDVRQDCVIGSGGALSALMALANQRVRTVDLDWRLRENYSRNVPIADVSGRCRQLIWVNTGNMPARRIEPFCRPEPSYFVDTPHGVVTYPQVVSFSLCLPRRE